MKRLLSLVGLLFAGVLLLQGSANASLKFKNGTPNTIWTAHAFSSTSGFLCGYNDGCSGSRGEWRVQGWWAIAPGGTATVQSATYGNAYHDYYAEDSLGHIWASGGGRYPVDQAAFDVCQNDIEPIGCITFDCPSCPPCQTGNTVRMLDFRRLRGSRCCGGSCQSDYTLTFVL